MHFSLISTPTVTEFRSRAELLSAAVQSASREPQLGILSVAAVLEQHGDNPQVLDANAEYMRFALGSPAPAATPNTSNPPASNPPASDIDGFAHHLATLAVRSDADVYGLSTICSTYPLTLRIAREIRHLRPHSHILLGGPQASVVDVATLETFPHIDLILRGEVESSLPLLLDQLIGDSNFAQVPGLTFRDARGASPFPIHGTQHGNIVRTPNAPVIEDLDSIPSPAYHLSAHLDGADSAPIELGRGCPFACTFCSTNDFFRRRFRLRSPARVLAEMRLLNARHGIRDFDLVHDMFTVDRKRVVAFCEAMAASGDGFTWRCSARTDCVDDALLEQMALSGCRSVFFGIESGSKRIQRIIDKDLDPDYAEDMLASAERHGIRSTASLITGFPQEEWQDVRDTLRIFIRSARCSRSHPQLNLLAPLANTPIYHAHKHEMELEELCSDMSHQGLSQHPEDLAAMRNYPEIFSNFYMVPAPALDRELLFELRQWLTTTVELFRWHLCRIAQQHDLLNFVRQWRTHRESLTGPLSGSALRLYYVGHRFQPDFLAWLQQAFATDPVMQALLHAGETVASAALSSPDITPGEPVTPGEHLQPGDTLSLDPTTRLLTLPYDLDGIIQALAANAEPAQTGPIPYATLTNEAGTLHLRRITPLLAALLQQCTGSSIAASLAAALTSIEAHLPAGTTTQTAKYLAWQLMLGAHRDSWLQVHRRPTHRDPPAASQPLPALTTAVPATTA